MPERPLYQGTEEAQLGNGGNAGLWYDKFCDKWTFPPAPRSGSSAPIVEIDKVPWINTVTTQASGNPEELQQFCQRQLNLVKALNGQWLLMRATGPFVTGMGRNHPVENGFLWHPTLAVPYLSGSSVKGMVGAWVEYWHRKRDDRQQLLGSQQAVGEVMFFDALPLKPVGLKTDIMTPHYNDYYQKGDAPGDWISPVPIPFLAVREGAIFCFAIVPRRPSDKSVANCKIVRDWLEEALEWIGIGAKTSVGYGRFVQDEGETKKLDRQNLAEQEAHERKKRLAALPPIKRDIEEFLVGLLNKAMPEHTAVIKEIENNRWEGNDKVEAAKWVRENMKENKKWKEASQAKKPEKDKDFQQTRLVMGWLHDT